MGEEQKEKDNCNKSENKLKGLVSSSFQMLMKSSSDNKTNSSMEADNQPQATSSSHGAVDRLAVSEDESEDELTMEDNPLELSNQRMSENSDSAAEEDTENEADRGEAESNYAEDSSDTVIMDQNDDDNTDQSFNTDSHKNESEEGNDPDSDTDVKSILKNLEIRVSKLNPSFSRYVVVDSINSADDSNDDNQVIEKQNEVEPQPGPSGINKHRKKASKILAALRKDFNDDSDSSQGCDDGIIITDDDDDDIEVINEDISVKIVKESLKKDENQEPKSRKNVIELFDDGTSSDDSDFVGNWRKKRYLKGRGGSDSLELVCPSTSTTPARITSDHNYNMQKNEESVTAPAAASASLPTLNFSDIDDLITNRSSLPDDTLVATNNTSNSDVVNAPSASDSNTDKPIVKLKNISDLRWDNINYLKTSNQACPTLLTRKEREERLNVKRYKTQMSRGTEEISIEVAGAGPEVMEAEVGVEVVEAEAGVEVMEARPYRTVATKSTRTSRGKMIFEKNDREVKVEPESFPNSPIYNPISSPEHSESPSPPPAAVTLPTRYIDRFFYNNTSPVVSPPTSGIRLIAQTDRNVSVKREVEAVPIIEVNASDDDIQHIDQNTEEIIMNLTPGPGEYNIVISEPIDRNVIQLAVDTSAATEEHETSANTENENNNADSAEITRGTGSDNPDIAPTDKDVDSSGKKNDKNGNESGEEQVRGEPEKNPGRNNPPVEELEEPRPGCSFWRQTPIQPPQPAAANVPDVNVADDDSSTLPQEDELQNGGQSDADNNPVVPPQQQSEIVASSQGVTSLTGPPNWEEKYNDLFQTHIRLVSSLQNLMECPICFEIPKKAPIPCCRNGHLMCSSCLGNSEIRECPACKVAMNANNHCLNTLANSILDLIPHSCRFKIHGCQHEDLPTNMKAHEQNCKHREVKCPYYLCKEQIPMSGLSSHYDVHNDAIYDVPRIHYKIHKPENPSAPFRFRYDGHMFYYQVMNPANSAIIYNFVQMEGSLSDCCKYRCHIQLLGEGNIPGFSQSVHITPLDLHCSDDLQKIGFVMIYTKMSLEDYLNEEDSSYKIHIKMSKIEKQESDKLLVKLERSLDTNNENDNQPTRGVKRPASDVIQDAPNPVPQPAAPENGSARIFSYVPNGDIGRRPVVIGPAGPSRGLVPNTPVSQAAAAAGPYQRVTMGSVEVLPAGSPNTEEQSLDNFYNRLNRKYEEIIKAHITQTSGIMVSEEFKRFRLMVLLSFCYTERINEYFAVSNILKYEGKYWAQPIFSHSPDTFDGYVGRLTANPYKACRDWAKFCRYVTYLQKKFNNQERTRRTGGTAAAAAQSDQLNNRQPEPRPGQAQAEGGPDRKREEGRATTNNDVQQRIDRDRFSFLHHRPDSVHQALVRARTERDGEFMREYHRIGMDRWSDWRRDMSDYRK